MSSQQCLHIPGNVCISCKFLYVCMVIVSSLVCSSYSKCDFEAIFNFGDSNSDTGGLNAAFPSQALPYGVTHFKRATGRATDGRVYVDFLAQALGLPFLSPYLQSIGSDFRHGANFATSASTVLLPTSSLFVSWVSPFALPIQLNQIKHFKAQVDEFHPKGRKLDSCDCSSGSELPSPDIFGKSIYTFYIGQNDFTSQLGGGAGGVKGIVPQVVNQIVSTIKELYALGGRTFLVLNLAPVGCYPAFLVELPHDAADIDEFGCMISYNNAVVEYNNFLKETLRQTRGTLSDASIIYVDTYSVLLELFRHPTSYGLQFGTKACCGYGGGAYNFDPKVICGNPQAIACEDPQHYVSWDGIHATEIANKFVTWAILNGSIFDPPFQLHQRCDIQPIG